MKIDKGDVARKLLDLGLQDAYMLPIQNDEEPIIVILQVRMDNNTNHTLRNKLSLFTGRACCVTTTQLDIPEDYCILRNAEVVA